MVPFWRGLRELRVFKRVWLGAGVGRVWPPGAQGTAVAVIAGGSR